MVKKELTEQEQIAKELEQWVRKMRCTGSTGIKLDNFTDIKIGADNSPVDRNSKTFEVFQFEDLKDFVKRTSEQSLQEIQLVNGDLISGVFVDGLRHGYCEILLQDPVKSVISIRGEYVDGYLNGKARINFEDRCWLEGYFKSGVLHGFTRKFDKKGRLTFVGSYQNGKPIGVCWRIKRGGGSIVGRVIDGEFSGCRIAYIYPDFLTALVGVFEKGELIKAQEAEVQSIIDGEQGVKIPVFGRPKGPFHCREIGTFDKICTDMTLKDPYESKTIEIKRSNIPGAAEGIFVIKDVEPNTVLGFYNGSRANPQEFDPTTWETNNYKIFDPSNIPAGTIDIPVWAQATKSYCCTLAHKCNHSFLPNSEFVVYDHPKFGVIPCIITIADIFKGEEVFVGYGYDLEDSPDWYQQAWKDSIFALEGVSYKDWMECNVKRPLGIRANK